MSLVETMEEGRRRAISETEIAIPKDDGLLIVYALLLEELRKQTPSPADGSKSATDAAISAELDLTLGKIRDLRANVYELTDVVIAKMAERAAPPPRPDRIARTLAGSAALFSLASLAVVIATSWT